MKTDTRGRIQRLPKRKPRPWISPAGAARYLSRSRSTIYRYCDEGRIESWREPGSRELKLCPKSVEAYARKCDGHSEEEAA